MTARYSQHVVLLLICWSLQLRVLMLVRNDFTTADVPLKSRDQHANTGALCGRVDS